MSNLSTLPKGDSAWLLRKAIERIIDQVSVLETNIGSSTTGNSANTQIIFNDDGTLRGDSGLTFNKTTDTLSTARITASGDAIVCSSTGDFYVGTTVSPQFKVERATGTATITGDLTVDTSTLKVDSTNNRVGINTASPAVGYALDVRGNIAGGNGTIFGGITFSSRAEIGALSNHDVGFIANSVTQYLIAVGGTHTWFNGGSTAMTLDSTGLGVGRSPSYRFQASSGTKATTASLTTVGGVTTTDTDDFGIFFRLKTDATATNRYSAISSFDNGGGNGARDLVLQDLGGNVGIGVTLSAWRNTQRALQVGAVGSFFSSVTSTGSTYIGRNFYESTAGNFTYIVNDEATAYEQTADGKHIWYNAAAGTGTITFTQAMTLDASGNLLVNAASFAVNNGKLRIQHSGLAGEWGIQTKSSTTDGYVGVFYTTTGQAGFISVSGTSTTFSTTSDYRLKENVQPIVGGLARINTLKPSTYKWKADGSNSEGFIAHELAEVVPAAVTGQKDAVNTDGSIKPQGVDLSKLVPILVAAIQELTTRVQTLEAR